MQSVSTGIVRAMSSVVVAIAMGQLRMPRVSKTGRHASLQATAARALSLALSLSSGLRCLLLGGADVKCIPGHPPALPVA